MPENQNKVKATIATVKLGYLEFEGLQLPNGEFAIAVPQIAKLFPYFQDYPNQASKKLKRLMGKEFKATKITTEFNRNITLCLSVDGFIEVIKALSKLQDSVALSFIDLLIGVSLQQLFCDAFGQQFEQEERQRFLKARQEGKLKRLNFTDEIKHYIDTTHLPELKKKYLYANATNAVYQEIFGMTANEIKQELQNKALRDSLTEDELWQIASLEELAARLMYFDQIEPLQAVREAARRLCIDKLDFHFK